jgi:hypothetical protein
MVSKRPERLSEHEHQKAQARPISGAETRLGVALLGPPVSWAIHLALNYGLVYPAQRWQTKGPLHVVTALATLPAVFAIIVGLRNLRRPRPAGASEQVERVRFMAACACIAGVFFLLAVLAQSVPLFMLDLERRQ